MRYQCDANGTPMDANGMLTKCFQDTKISPLVCQWNADKMLKGYQKNTIGMPMMLIGCPKYANELPM
jgi:hypothetical protein